MIDGGGRDDALLDGPDDLAPHRDNGFKIQRCTADGAHMDGKIEDIAIGGRALELDVHRYCG
ncbi:hypothetical protein FQZ97_1246400 [compost metagenome]